MKICTTYTCIAISLSWNLHTKSVNIIFIKSDSIPQAFYHSNISSSLIARLMQTEEMIQFLRCERDDIALKMLWFLQIVYVIDLLQWNFRHLSRNSSVELLPLHFRHILPLLRNKWRRKRCGYCCYCKFSLNWRPSSVGISCWPEPCHLWFFC